MAFTQERADREDSVNVDWSAFVSLFVTNLIPIGGVLVFEWNLGIVLFIYWIECGVVIVLTSKQSLTARRIQLPLPGKRRRLRLRTKRGTIQVPFLATEFPVRNSVCVAHLSAVFLMWVGSGILFVHPASHVSYSTFNTPSAFVIGILAVSLPHILYNRTYVQQQQYVHSSPERLMDVPAWYFVLFCAGCTLVLTNINAADASLSDSRLRFFVVAGLLAWIVIRLYLYWHQGRLSDPLDQAVDPFSYQQQHPSDAFNAEATLPTVDHPSDRPQYTFQPNPQFSISLVPSTVSRAISRLALFGPLFFAVVGLLFLIVSFATSDTNFLFVAAVAFAGAYFIIPVPAMIHELLTNCTLQYECYEDRLVCYDHWLGQSQWELRYDAITQISVQKSWMSDLLGYGNLQLETKEGQAAELAYLTEYEKAAKSFEALADGTSFDGRPQLH